MEDRSKKLIKNTFIIAAGRMSSQLSSFILLPIFTRFLSQGEYGDYDLYLSYIALLFPIISLQLDQSLYRELLINSKLEKKKNVISTVVVFVCIILFIIAIISAVISFIINNGVLNRIVFLLASSTLNMIFLNISRGMEDNVTYAIALVVQSILNLCFSIFLLVFLNLGLKEIIIALGISYLASTGYICIKKHIYNYCKIRYVKIIELKEYLKYSLPLIPNSLSWWINSSSDKVIVRIFIGSMANGLLAISQKISNIYSLMFNMVQYSWIELATANRESEDVEEYYADTFDKIIRLFAALGGGIIIGVYFFYDIYIGEGYTESKKMIPIYFIGLYFSIISGLYATIYMAYGESMALAKSTIIASIINLVVDILLIKKIGLMAAPISSLAAYIYLLIYRYFNVRKLIDINLDIYHIIEGLIILLLSLVLIWIRIGEMQLITLLFIIVISIHLCKDYLKTLYNKIITFYRKDNL